MNDVDYKQRLLSDKLDLEELMTLAKESSAAVELDQSMVDVCPVWMPTKTSHGHGRSSVGGRWS